MADLATRYLGLDLRSPLVASPSPATGSLDSLLRLDDAGVGAVVLPSLFEEEVESEALTLADRMEAGSGVFGEASEYFPDLDLDHLGLERHVLLVEQASERLTAPVIASVNGRSAGGWVRYASELVAAGARAVELNMYDVVADPSQDGAVVEQGYLALIAEVRRAVDVPIAVKLSPFFSSVGSMALRAVAAGADGLVLFNRFYAPDLDLATLDVVPRLDLSHAGEIRLPLRWIAILRPHLPTTSLALTSGVSDGPSIAKALLAGADVAMTASEVLRRGPERAGEMIAELQAWLDENDYASVDQLRGSLAQHSAPDPGAFERAQYQKVLASWRRR